MVPALAGMGVGAGLTVIAAGMLGGLRFPARASRRPWTSRPLLLLDAALATLVATLTVAATGWVVGALLTGAGAVAFRRAVAARDRHSRTVERTEAVASWAEMLRDTMAAAAGIEQAVVTTAAVAPPAIRPAVRRLAADLERRRLVPTLREFADELADPAADLVVTGLVLASERQVRELGALLGALAQAARREAALMVRIEAGRARTRTAARVVTVTTLGFAGALIAFNRPFLEPYNTVGGQLWLLVVGAVFGIALWHLQRLARLDPAPRLLTGRSA